MTDVVNELDGLPATVKDELLALYERDGKLTAESMLTFGSDPSTALHHQIEWDDSVAAHEHRLEQCRRIARSFLITIEDRPVRLFPFVPSAGTYAPIRDAMSNKSWRDEIIAQFERDAARFDARWQNHKVVADSYRRWKSKI